MIACFRQKMPASRPTLYIRPFPTIFTMPSPLSTNHWKWLSFGWLFFCTVLFCMPGNALPKTKLVNIPYFDKWVHLLLFALLCFLLLKAWRPMGGKAIALWLLMIIGYGIAIEFIQLYLVPFRSFDVVDISADSAGSIIGLLLYNKWCNHC